jgi:hypothetical protein
VKTRGGGPPGEPLGQDTRALEARIAAVRDGSRPVPRTLAELEGRR